MTTKRPPTELQRRPAISWTDAEKQKVLTRAHALLRADKTLGRMAAINRAQDVLPEARRRPEIRSLNREGWISFPQDILDARREMIDAAAALQRGEPVKLAKLAPREATRAKKSASAPTPAVRLPHSRTLQDDEDRRKVLEQAIKLLRADKTLGRLAALEKAQSVLPAVKRLRKVPQLPSWAVFPDDVLAARAGSIARSEALKRKSSPFTPAAGATSEPTAATRRSTAKTSDIVALASGEPAFTVEELAPKLPELPPIEGVAGTGRTLRWTASERATVTRYAAFAVYYKQAKSLREAVVAGSLPLPEQRRRTNLNEPGSGAAPGWLRPAVEREIRLIRDAEQRLLQERIAQAEKEAAQAAQAAQDTPDEPVATPSMREYDLRQIEEDAAMLQRAGQPVLNGTAAAVSHVLDSLRGAAVDFIAGVLLDSLHKVVREAPSILRHALASSAVPEQPEHESAMSEPVTPQAPVPPHRPYLPTQPKQRLTRVLIAGGDKKAVPEILKARFGHKLDLRFWLVSESRAALRDRVVGADLTLGWTKFLGHSEDSICDARAQRYFRVGGGIDALTDKLDIISTTPLDELSTTLNVPLHQHTNGSPRAAVAH